MINQPDRQKHSREKASSCVSSPLLCWDVAHPLLRKHQEIADDLKAFAQLKTHFDWQIETDLRHSLADNTTLIVTDRATRIAWVSHSFHSLTGYQPAEIVGKHPGLLQGPMTNGRTKQTVRLKLASTQSVAVSMLNYRKDGTPYWCQIDIQPLWNSQHECTHFLAFEKELTGKNR